MEDYIARFNFTKEFTSNEEKLVRELVTYAYKNNYEILLFLYGSTDIVVIDNNFCFSSCPLDFSHSICLNPSRINMTIQDFTDIVINEINKGLKRGLKYT